MTYFLYTTLLVLEGTLTVHFNPSVKTEIVDKEGHELYYEKRHCNTKKEEKQLVELNVKKSRKTGAYKENRG